jgi:O-acetyl-ADP-ribose deacetylase (regulator of RNase III)
MISEAREKRKKLEISLTARLASGIDVVYRVSDNPSQAVEIVTGSLRDIRSADVIVSSENTYLQPARFFDRSMSGTLRYLDAEKNPIDLRVRRDAYFEALQAAIAKEQVEIPVLPGSVLAMRTTALQTQGVKYVFHAATVEGEVEKGYRGNEDAIDSAVLRCFEKFAEISREDPITSILFPVFGAGSGRLFEDLAASRLVEEVLSGLNRSKGSCFSRLLSITGWLYGGQPKRSDGGVKMRVLPERLVGSSHSTKSAKWTRGEIDPATRITLALLSRLFNWRDALIVVQPKTLIRWHRAGVSTSVALEIKTGAPSDCR